MWIATGHTDMRRATIGLALQVQQGLRCDPHAGELFLSRGRRSDLIKILWHDDLGMSLYAERLESGRFTSPSATEERSRSVAQPCEFGTKVRINVPRSNSARSANRSFRP